MKRNPVRGPVSLKQFKDINVLNLPVISVSDEVPRLPVAFFLHNGFHIVYVELKKQSDSKDQFVIYDSWPHSSKVFREFFTRRNLETKKERVVGGKAYRNESGGINPVTERAVQRRPSSASCSLFAVCASLEIFFRPTVTDFWMWKVIYPILRKRPFPGIKVLRELSNTI